MAKGESEQDESGAELAKSDENIKKSAAVFTDRDIQIIEFAAHPGDIHADFLKRKRIESFDTDEDALSIDPLVESAIDLRRQIAHKHRDELKELVEVNHENELNYKTELAKINKELSEAESLEYEIPKSLTEALSSTMDPIADAHLIPDRDVLMTAENALSYLDDKFKQCKSAFNHADIRLQGLQHGVDKYADDNILEKLIHRSSLREAKRLLAERKKLISDLSAGMQKIEELMENIKMSAVKIDALKQGKIELSNLNAARVDNFSSKKEELEEEVEKDAEFFSGGVHGIDEPWTREKLVEFNKKFGL
ncbi:TPA: hypothetical protein DEP96_02325 [Candidatus Uhrbacteria bacterium]|nr:hypothetical protein [Candidatus Uhrbacteria bacterium]